MLVDDVSIYLQSHHKPVRSTAEMIETIRSADVLRWILADMTRLVRGDPNLSDVRLEQMTCDACRGWQSSRFDNRMQSGGELGEDRGDQRERPCDVGPGLRGKESRHRAELTGR